MKELVVISGKGGTGKTSLVASFAALAKRAVLADCDVDAADLYLILKPHIQQREAFYGGKVAVIQPDQCTGCGLCMEKCRFGAITEHESPSDENQLVYSVDPIACEGCGVCYYICPEDAISLVETKAGEWFISETRYGPMVYAKLGIAAENSGKLVTVVRTNARRIANEQELDFIIVDGSPGTGCPVISSITGADLVLVVTEPTMSGHHDLTRVVDLTTHFKIPTLVCVNKWDINPSVCLAIQDWSEQHGVEVAGRIRYDNTVTKAQIAGKSIVEFGNGRISSEIKTLWRRIEEKLR